MGTVIPLKSAPSKPSGHKQDHSKWSTPPGTIPQSVTPKVTGCGGCETPQGTPPSTPPQADTTKPNETPIPNQSKGETSKVEPSPKKPRKGGSGGGGNGSGSKTKSSKDDHGGAGKKSEVSTWIGYAVIVLAMMISFWQFSEYQHRNKQKDQDYTKTPQGYQVTQSELAVSKTYAETEKIEALAKLAKKSPAAAAYAAASMTPTGVLPTMTASPASAQPASSSEGGQACNPWRRGMTSFQVRNRDWCRMGGGTEENMTLQFESITSESGAPVMFGISPCADPSKRKELSTMDINGQKEFIAEMIALGKRTYMQPCTDVFNNGSGTLVIKFRS